MPRYMVNITETVVRRYREVIHHDTEDLALDEVSDLLDNRDIDPSESEVTDRDIVIREMDDFEAE